jgi:hypothetical protein
MTFAIDIVVNFNWMNVDLWPLLYVFELTKNRSTVLYGDDSKRCPQHQYRHVNNIILSSWGLGHMMVNHKVDCHSFRSYYQDPRSHKLYKIITERTFAAHTSPPRSVVDSTAAKIVILSLVVIKWELGTRLSSIVFTSYEAALNIYNPINTYPTTRQNCTY